MIARGGKDAPLRQLFALAPGAVLPLPQFFEDAPVGFVNVSPDADGLVRQIPLLIRFGDAVYPSLALQSLMRALGTDALRLYTGPDGLFSVAAGDFKIPVSREGYMLVPFQGDGAHTDTSARQRCVQLYYVWLTYAPRPLTA